MSVITSYSIHYTKLYDGETGRETDAESVLPFLGHEDYRVQLEALMCMYKIGGKQRKKLLLTALSEATEGIKIKIIVITSYSIHYTKLYELYVADAFKVMAKVNELLTAG